MTVRGTGTHGPREGSPLGDFEYLETCKATEAGEASLMLHRHSGSVVLTAPLKWSGCLLCAPAMPCLAVRHVQHNYLALCLTALSRNLCRHGHA